MAFLLAASAADAQTIPAQANQYRRQMIASVRLVWGLNAPISFFAAQVAQESGFRANAKSAYAGGLSQFTESTAIWISKVYPDELGDVDIFNPAWSLRAQARFTKHLYDQATFAATSCDKFSFLLSGYNGGSGWWSRDRALAKKYGADTTRWFWHVEKYSSRSAAAFQENRSYVKRIIYVWQPRFIEAGWGLGVRC